MTVRESAAIAPGLIPEWGPIVDQDPDAIVVADAEGMVTFWNTTASHLFGRSSSDACGRHFASLFGPEELRVSAAVRRALDGEPPENESEFLVRVERDGSSVRFVNLRFRRLVADENSRTVGVIGRATDVTRRVQEEVERARFFESSSELFCIATLDGYFIRVNPAFVRTLGYTAAELYSKPFLEFIHPEDRAATMGSMQGLSEGVDTVEFENRYRCRDGSFRWLSWMCPAPRPGMVHLYGVARDITRRKAAEAELAQSERELRLLCENVPGPFCHLGPDFRYRFVNRSYEELVGKRNDQIIGSLVEEVIGPAPFARVRQHFDLALRGERVTYEVDLQLPHDIKRSLQGILIPRFRDGEVDGVFGLISDLTELKTLQRELLRIASEEQRRIGHDLHDGLGQELMALGLTAGSLVEELQDAGQSAVELAGKLRSGIQDAVRQVRELSKGLVPVVVDRGGLGHALTGLAETISQLDGVSCRCHESGTVEVHDNQVATHLYRIAQEAVSNAVKHGGAANLDLTLVSRDGNIELRIVDDGCGFPESPADDGMGLRIMKYRAGLIGATMAIERDGANGTVIRCTLEGPLAGNVTQNHAEVRPE